MTEDLYERARIVRHTLTAWSLLFVAIAVGLNEYIGWVLVPIIAGVGFVAAGRLVFYGFWRQTLVISALLVAALFIPPNLKEIDNISRRTIGKPILKPKPPPDPVFLPSRTEVRTPSRPQPLRPMPPEPVVTSKPTPVAPEAPIDRIAKSPNESSQIPDFKVTALTLVGEYFGSQNQGEWNQLRGLLASKLTFQNEEIEADTFVKTTSERLSNWAQHLEVLDGEVTIERGENGRINASLETKFKYTVDNEIGLFGHRQHKLALIPNGTGLLISEHSYSETLIPYNVDRFVTHHAEKALAFVLGTLAEEARNDIDALQKRYESEVQYFGKSLTREVVMKDKSDYAIRWPIRSEQILGGLELSTTGDDHVGVSFLSSFRVESEDRQEWRTGSVHHFLTLRHEGNSFLIIEQRGDVTITGKGSLPAPQSPIKK